MALETYNSVMESATTSTQVASSGDASLLLGVGVATVALVGLAVIQLPKILNEEGGQPLTNGLAPAPPATQPPMKAVQEKRAAVVESKAVEPEKKDAEVAVETEDNIELPVEPVPFFAVDDLTREEQKVVREFDTDDRVGLLGSLRRVSGLVRTARKELEVERELRIEVETHLTEAAEEMLDLEDAVELGQNKLTKTTLELSRTKNFLSATQTDLARTRKDLQVLEEERKSVRKMGKAAWQLSKERVGKRIRKIRRKEEVVN